MEIEECVKEIVRQDMEIDNEEIKRIHLNFEERDFSIIKTGADSVYLIEENKRDKEIWNA